MANLVEISEMLKGVPDTYLTKHVQSPDGTVPQYLALAELQRRQDMRARFAQQAPQTTVAEDAAQGIAAGVPMEAPMGAPPEAPMQGGGIAGYAQGGKVRKSKDLLAEYEKKIADVNPMDEIYIGDYFQSPLDSLLKMTGLRATDRQRKIGQQYFGEAAKRDESVKEQLAAQAAENAAALQPRRAAQAASTPIQPLDESLVQQAADVTAIQSGRPGQYLAARQRMRDRERANATDPDLEAMEYLKDLEPTPIPMGGQSPRPPVTPENMADYDPETGTSATYNQLVRQGVITGYKDGGSVDPYYANLVNAYIGRAAKFESGNNRNAKNPLSTASGRFQLLKGTRARLDKKYGFDPKDRSDETELARMKAYTQETINSLEKSNIPVTGGTLYGGHFLGQKGVVDFFEAYRNDPNKKVTEHFSAEVIRKNPAIFNPRGGKSRTTLAEVMEKFDRVGNSKMRTPSSDEDIGLGAAMQVANRADRGDIGPYEDMNMNQAMALATLLEKSKLGQGPLVGYPDTQRNPPPSFFYNPTRSAGIMGGVRGFDQGGSVGNFYTDTAGNSYPIADLEQNVVTVINPITGKLEVVPNFVPGSGEPVGNFYTNTSGISAPIADLALNPVTVIGSSTASGANSSKDSKKPKGANKSEGAKRPKDTGNYDIIELLGPSAYEQMNRPTFESEEESDRFTYPAQAALYGRNFLTSVVPNAPGAALEFAGERAIIPAAEAVSDFFTLPAGELKKKWARSGTQSRSGPPSKFFSNPALTTPKGVGTGILGGGTTDFVAPSVAPEEAPPAPAAAPPGATADTTLIALPTPPPTPPVSRADQVADEFLNELKASRMSKDEMRQMALLQAGLGMMAGTSPFFGVNVGQGGMAGLQAYQQAKAQNQALASEAYKSMMAARALGLDERRVAATEASTQAEIDYRKKLLKFNEDKLTKMLNADPRSRGLSSAQWNTINAYGKELIGAKTAAGETVTIDDVKNIMRQLAGVAGEYAAGIEDAEPSARPRLSVAGLEE